MRMKVHIVVLMLCTGLCLSTALAKDKKSSGGAVEDQVKAMLEQSRQAALKGDSSYLEQNAADNYTRVNADGTLMNKTEAVNTLKNGDTKYQSIETSAMNVRVYGDTAIATYTADVKGTRKGQDTSGKNQVTRVFVKQGGKWREVAFQVTRVAQ